MKNIDWSLLSDFVEAMIKTKDDWRKEFADADTEWIQNLVAQNRSYWGAIDETGLGVFGKLIKERCIEIVEIGEAELLQRGSDD